MVAGFPPPAEVYTSESLRGFNLLDDLIVVVDCSGSERAGTGTQHLWCNTAAQSFFEERSLGTTGDTDLDADLSNHFPADLVACLLRKVQVGGASMTRRWALTRHPKP